MESLAQHLNKKIEVGELVGFRSMLDFCIKIGIITEVSSKYFTVYWLAAIKNNIIQNAKYGHDLEPWKRSFE